jgi:hypothetical protein
MFKKAMIAAGIAAMSMSAFAQNNITPSSSGDGDLWVGAQGFDSSGAQVTYLYNTDVSLSYFTPGSVTANTSFSQAVTGWSNFTGLVSNLANVQWMALAADTTGTAATPGDYRYIGTSDRTGAQIQADTVTGDRMNNADFNSLESTQIGLVNYHNNPLNTFAASSNTGKGFSIVQGSNNGGYSNNRLTDLGMQPTAVDFDADAALGQTRNVLFIQRGTGNNTALANLQTLGNVNGNSLMSLSSAGVFTYTAPIPEPGEWAMMLAGLGMVGAIARRRRSV